MQQLDGRSPGGVPPPRIGMADGSSPQSNRTQPDASALPLLGVGNNFRLKKGTMWGADGKGAGKLAQPVLSVSGRGFEGDVGGGARANSLGSPRPPSSSTGHGRSGVHSSPASADRRGMTARVQQLHHGHMAASPGAAVSSVLLTLESPPITSRRLAPSAISAKQATLSAAAAAAAAAAAGAVVNGMPATVSLNSPLKAQGHIHGLNGATPTNINNGSSIDLDHPHGRDIMRIDTNGCQNTIQPACTSLPNFVVSGGESEIAWLREKLAEGLARNEQLAAQLQRVQQESHGLRSTLLAQQGAKADAGPSDALNPANLLVTPRGVRISHTHVLAPNPFECTGLLAHTVLLRSALFVFHAILTHLLHALYAHLIHLGVFFPGRPRYILCQASSSRGKAPLAGRASKIVRSANVASVHSQIRRTRRRKRLFTCIRRARSLLAASWTLCPKRFEYCACRTERIRCMGQYAIHAQSANILALGPWPPPVLAMRLSVRQPTALMRVGRLPSRDMTTQT